MNNLSHFRQDAQLGLAQLNRNADRIAANRNMLADQQKHMASLANQRQMLGMQQAHEKDLVGRKALVLQGLVDKLR